MSTHVETVTNGLDQVCEMLVTEFAGRLDERIVRFEVASAERELRGQVPPGSVEEMAHRLATQRLHQRCQATGASV